jgi:hypothetical protein
VTPQDVAADLETARALARAGVPIFLARQATDDRGVWRPDGGHSGCGYWLPRGWEQTQANPATLDAWRPGMAVCAVMGHGLDALDVDPRNGGAATRDGMIGAGLWPRAYAEAATPSGGTHDLVAALDVASRDGIRPGLDVKAGTVDGDGRGFIFIAPTVKLSKTTGEVAAYRWTKRPDLELWAEERATDDTGQAVAEMIRQARANGAGTSSEVEAEPYTGPPFAELAENERAAITRWTAGAVAGVCAELAESATWPPGHRDEQGRGWERLQADCAYRLGRLARASWNGLTVAEAQAAFTQAAPTGAGWTREDVAEKWRTQHARKSAAPYPSNLTIETAPVVVPSSAATSAATASGGGHAERRSVATQLVDLADTRWRFAISTEGEAFALPMVGPQVVRMLTGSRSIRAELADIYQDTTGKVAGAQALADAVLVLEGRARRNEPVPLALRVAEDQGAVWLDLGTLTGEAVRITAAGWEVVPEPPILFRRTALSGVLPEPQVGGDLGELWSLLNVVPESRPVLLAWLVAALLPEIPHPVAALVGEQGTGKTTASRMLAGLLDPSPAQLRKPPRDVEGWTTAAAGSWVVGVDNLSTIPTWWSDSLCRAVTGDGDVRRRLYSDADLTVFAFRRVVLLNGIDLGAVRDDLAERLLTVELHRITERRYDADLSRAWADAHPRILGALLDLAAQVLKLLPDVVLPDPPRMADFARVLAAVDQVLGTSGLDTYARLASDLAADAVTGDPVLSAITETIQTQWTGTAAELLDLIGDPDPEHRKAWPNSPRGMTSLLRRRAPSLRRLGWTVEDLGRGGHDKLLRFRIAPPRADVAADVAEVGPRFADVADDQHPHDHGPLTCADAESAPIADVADVETPQLSTCLIHEEEEQALAYPTYGVGGETTSATSATSAGRSQGARWTALLEVAADACAVCGEPLHPRLAAEGESTHPACSEVA